MTRRSPNVIYVDDVICVKHPEREGAEVLARVDRIRTTATDQLDVLGYWLDYSVVIA